MVKLYFLSVCVSSYEYKDQFLSRLNEPHLSFSPPVSGSLSLSFTYTDPRSSSFPSAREQVNVILKKIR